MTKLRVLAASVLVAGVVCQFVQQTDPRFPLVYYTVDSATLTAAVLLVLRTPHKMMAARVHGAAVTGVVFSALIYATVIVPASPSDSWFTPHDDLWVRVATVLLHGVAPALVVADYLMVRPPVTPVFREAIAFLWWPLSYLAVMGILAWTGLVQIPYSFLSPTASSPALVAAAIPALAAITTAIAAALLKLSLLIATRPAANT